jgi:hypothetical protein
VENMWTSLELGVTDDPWSIEAQFCSNGLGLRFMLLLHHPSLSRISMIITGLTSGHFIM